jgi:hypothetical protein
MKSESNLEMLAIGEKKADVEDILGPADRLRASKRLDDGSILEVREYDIFSRNHALFDALMCPLTLTISCWTPLPSQYSNPYWLQFVNGKLNRWGQAGDWQANVSADINIHH